MNLKMTASIILGKSILELTKRLKIGGGSAAPGYFALKIYPNLLFELTRLIPKTIIITGTNGKTTTAKMLSDFAERGGFNVIRNSTGSNLERGIVSALISKNPSRYNLAIWELDEAAFSQIATKLNPDIIVFLNIFRDQLDRYGEIDTTLAKWHKTLKNLQKKTKVFINGDDANLEGIKNLFKEKVSTFGVEGQKIEGEKVNNRSGKLDFKAGSVQTLGLDGSTFTVSYRPKETAKVTLPVPGLYHIYDFLAAYSCAKFLGIKDKQIKRALENFSPVFGRVEKINFPEGQGYIFLIKNPVGATQVFQTIKEELKSNDHLLLALNDNLADGTDVSWIWDADFELLFSPSLRAKGEAIHSIYVSGTRAEDLALRLKYAGLDQNNITIEDNLKRALEQARKGLKGRLFILPTYTALLKLQRILANSDFKQHYWEEK